MRICICMYPESAALLFLSVYLVKIFDICIYMCVCGHIYTPSYLTGRNYTQVAGTLVEGNQGL